MPTGKRDKKDKQSVQQQPNVELDSKPSTKIPSTSDKSKDEQTNNDSHPSSERRSSSSENGNDGQAQGKQGFSILNSLAKFMSREKSESGPILEPLPEPETESESDAVLSQQTADNNSMSSQSQTFKISARRSSTLNAITKAVNALKEVRRRVAVMAKNKEDGDMESLQSEETQTSYSNPFVDNDDPDFSLHQHPHFPAKSRSAYSAFRDQYTTGSYPNFGNSSVTEPRSFSESDLKTYEQYREMDDRNAYHGKTKTATKEHSRNDDTFDNSDGVLFHSTPKPGHAKHANVQTGAGMEMKGTQTSSTSTRVMNNDKDRGRGRERNRGTDNSLADLNAIARRLLADREKCSKCDLFELMFLHGGDKILKDKDIIGMFKRHMNKHLLKSREDKTKYDKKTRKKAEAQHLHDALSLQQLSSNQQNPRTLETSSQNDPVDDNSEVQLIRIGSMQLEIRNETGHKLIKPDHNPEARATDIKSKSDSDHSSETNENGRDQNEPRSSRDDDDDSPSWDQLFKKYLSAKKEAECLEQVKRRLCHRKKPNCCADSQERRGFDKRNFFIDWGNHTDYCERQQCRRVSNVNNSKCWGVGICNDDDDDECNYQCNNDEGDDGECYSPCPSYSDHMPCHDLSGVERQLKWLVKGMLIALKEHHGVKSTESNTNERESGSPSSKDGKDAKIEKAATSTEAETQPPADDKSSAKTKKKRQSSVLSDIAFSMVKDKGEKDSIDTKIKQEDPDSNLGKQDNTEKVPNSRQDADASSREDKLAAELLSNWIRKGKSGDDEDGTILGTSGNQTGTKSKDFDLDDPKVEDIIKTIFNVICSEHRDHDRDLEESTQENECEEDDDDDDIGNGAYPASCNPSIDHLVEQVCNILMAATTRNTTRVPGAQTCPFPVPNSTRCRSAGEHSCFYHQCNHNSSSNQQSYYGWLGGEPSCSSDGRPCTNRNYCNLSQSQEASKRNNRGKMRQQGAERSRRERETHPQQRRRQPCNVQAAPRNRNAQCSRPTTRENNLGGYSIFTNTTNNVAGTSQAFTYVVPQSRMFWQSQGQS